MALMSTFSLVLMGITSFYDLGVTCDTSNGVGGYINVPSFLLHNAAMAEKWNV